MACSLSRAPIAWGYRILLIDLTLRNVHPRDILDPAPRAWAALRRPELSWRGRMSSRAQERAAALLLAALEHNNPDLPEYPDAYLRWLAAALSAALAAREQQQASFASRVRSLCFNLKANHELRRQLCARERSAAETAAMSTSGVPSGRSNPNLAGFARDDSPRAAALQCTQADLLLTRLSPAPRP